MVDAELPKLTIEQRVGRIFATEEAIHFICDGLQKLSEIDAANDRIHIPLLPLSFGFERLAKIVLVLGLLEKDGTLLARKQLRNSYGHRTDKVIQDIAELCDRIGYSQRSTAIADDVKFISSDRVLAQFLEMFSDFGSNGRFHSLDQVLGSGATTSPAEAFQAIETDFFNSDPVWAKKIAQPDDFSDFYSAFNLHATSVLNRCARALCRMFTFGLLGDRGKQLSGIIGPFLFLRDEELSRRPARCA